MTIELTTGVVTPEKTYEAGELIDLPDVEARRYLAEGMAIPVPAKPEQAVKDEPKKELRRK